MMIYHHDIWFKKRLENFLGRQTGVISFSDVLMFWCDNQFENRDTQCKVCFEAKESCWRLNLQAMAIVRRVLIEIVMSFEVANSVFWVGQAGSSLVLWSFKAWFSFLIRYISFACLIWCFGRKLFCTKVHDPNLFVENKTILWIPLAIKTSYW